MFHRGIHLDRFNNSKHNENLINPDSELVNTYMTGGVR